ncbi:MAG: hypothetical protein ACFB9M_11170 [Myxococcota bacterium]
MPEPETKNGIRFVTGGVGERAEKHMAKMKDQYPLRVTMSTEGGKFVSGMSVSIADSSGKNLLTTHVQGPKLFVDLEPGEYRLEVAGPALRELQRSFTIEKGKAEDILIQVPSV